MPGTWQTPRGDDYLREGIQAVEKALKLRPDDIKLKVTYGGLMLEGKDLNKLIPYARDLINKHGGDVIPVRFLLIRTLIATGQHSFAREWLEPMRDHPDLHPYIFIAEQEMEMYQGPLVDD